MVIHRLPRWQWSLVLVVLYFVNSVDVSLFVFFLHLFGFGYFIVLFFIWVYFLLSRMKIKQVMIKNDIIN